MDELFRFLFAGQRDAAEDVLAPDAVTAAAGDGDRGTADAQPASGAALPGHPHVGAADRRHQLARDADVGRRRPGAQVQLQVPGSCPSYLGPRRTRGSEITPGPNIRDHETVLRH